MKYLILLSFYLIYLSCYSQNSVTENTHYKWFDSVINASNTDLLNGTHFKNVYRTLEGNNQYFLEKEFTPGNMVYNGQPYFDIPLKYDIYSDEVIIKSSDANGYFAIQLVKEHLKSFQIDNHYFINSKYVESDMLTINGGGFFEVLFEGDGISLFKKSVKTKAQRKNDKFAYFEFSYKSDFLLKYHDKITTINSKKKLIKLFPSHKAAINTFYKKNRIQMKSNHDLFLAQLIKHLEKLLKTT